MFFFQNSLSVKVKKFLAIVLFSIFLGIVTGLTRFSSVILHKTTIAPVTRITRFV